MKDGDDCSFGCSDHSQYAGGHRTHPELGHKTKGLLDENSRGAGHPQRHTKGKLRSQLNPDHGPHKGAGRHM